jgi:hypothetical protein
LQYRIPFDGWQLGATAAYGSQSFAFKADAVRTDLPPDVAYSSVRTGLFSSHQLGQSFDLNFSANYLFVLNPGMIRSEGYFPRASVGGIDLGAGLDFKFSKALGIGVSGGLRRYFFNMNSQPGDPNVAGGAVDQYPVGQLRIIYRM